MRLRLCSALILVSCSLAAQDRFVINAGRGWPVVAREVAYAEGLTAKSTSVSLGEGFHGGLTFENHFNIPVALVASLHYQKLERGINQSRFDLTGNSQPHYGAGQINNQLRSESISALIGVRHFPLGREGIYPWIGASVGMSYRLLVHKLEAVEQGAKNEISWTYGLGYSPVFQLNLGGRWQLFKRFSAGLALRFRYSSSNLEKFLQTVGVTRNQLYTGFRSQPERTFSKPFPASSLALLGSFSYQLLPPENPEEKQKKKPPALACSLAFFE